MYICVECGHLFEDGEERTSREYRGECHGFPAYETISSCPMCGGDFENAKYCDNCDEWYAECDLSNGYCFNCINSFKNDWQMCLKINDNIREPMELNSFLASVFDVSEIEQILLEKLKEKASIKPIDCSNYILGDVDFFASRLKKIRNEGK